MNRTLLAIILTCVAVVGGGSAQERGVVAVGADGVAEAVRARGVDTIEFWGGERAMYHYLVYGEGVAAEFQSVDTSTCAAGIETSVSVHGSQGVIYGNDEPIESNVVVVVISAFDRCLNMSLWSVTGTGPADLLHLDPNFKSASLRASIQGIDDAGNPVALAVDLVWNGAGQKDKTRDHEGYNEGVYKLVSNSTGTIREAVAGGTVTVGSLDVTPLPSNQGVIEKDTTRRLVVYR